MFALDHVNQLIQFKPSLRGIQLNRIATLIWCVQHVQLVIYYAANFFDTSQLPIKLQ